MTRRMDRQRRKMRVRKKIRGTRSRPRLAVYRSSKHVYAQIIDDDAGRTLVAAASCSKKERTAGDERSKSDTAFELGKRVAEACRSKGIKTVVFDRGGYEFHGRVAKVAEGAREGGLRF